MGFMSMSGLEMTKLAAMAVVALALGASPAAAQLSQSSDAPVDITADALEVINNECVSIWSGSAEALQDRTRLRADVIKTFSKKGAGRPGAAGGSCGALDRMEAIGNVYYVTPQQKVRGDNANYDVTAELRERAIELGAVPISRHRDRAQMRAVIANARRQGRRETP